MTRKGPNRKANIWTARIIPIFLLGIIGYSTWVATKKVCIDYLLNPAPSTLVHPRPGAAIAILVIYYVLLIPLFVCYGRLIQNILTNPGYVPRSAAWLARKAAEKNTEGEHRHNSRHAHRRRCQLPTEKDTTSRSSAESLEANAPPSPSTSEHNPAVSDFWQKDVFVCNFDGRPPFCSTCLNWKPDRTHHCSEVNRCVRKMDHFCPWVGGIVSETSFKFFIQFLFYTALFCTHTLIFTAYFLAERVRLTRFVDVHWILLLAFAGMFLLLSAGMFSSSMQFAALNVTTIENFDRHRKVWYLCVYLSRPEETLRRIEASGKVPPRTIPYPRPPEENAMILQSALGESIAEPKGTGDLQASQRTRLLAILELPAGANPWDRGKMANCREVLGYSLLEWLLPVKQSPCADHRDPVSMFRLGPAVEKAKREAGIVEDEDGDPKTPRRKRRRRSDAENEQSGNERKARRHRKRGKSSSGDAEEVRS